MELVARGRERMRAAIAGGRQRRRVGGAMRRLEQKLQRVVLGRDEGVSAYRGPLDLAASLRLSDSVWPSRSVNPNRKVSLLIK
jgi:hypothetical protein